MRILHPMFPFLAVLLAAAFAQAAPPKQAADKSACLKDIRPKVAVGRHKIQGTEEENFTRVTGLRWEAGYWQTSRTGAGGQMAMEVDAGQMEEALAKWCEARPQQRTEKLDEDMADNVRRMSCSALGEKGIEYKAAMSRNLGDARLYEVLNECFDRRVKEEEAAAKKKQIEASRAAALRTQDVLSQHKELDAPAEPSQAPGSSGVPIKEAVSSYRKDCARKTDGFNAACDQLRINVVFRCSQICQQMEDVCVGVYIRGTMCGDFQIEKNAMRDAGLPCRCPGDGR